MSNRAAWITEAKKTPLEVKEAPYPTPGANDIIVRTHSVAINPLEYKIQDTNPALGGKPIQYPTILGADLAGTVVEVGSAVTRCKVGDRIIANPSGLGKQSAAFQLFVQVPEHFAIPIPDGLPFEQAVVLPLACDTASAGLFTTLGLSTPPNKANQIVLIWGGSSSVGCCAIQLAHAAGYTVFTTASKRNHDLCRSLGASQVFDHSHDNVEEEVIKAMQGEVAGALDCIASESTISSCVRILSSGHKVATVLTPPENAAKDGVEVQRLSIPSFLGSSEYAVVHSWIEKALADGTLQPKPDARVIGEGLESIQDAIDVVRKGVSATKIVVKL